MHIHTTFSDGLNSPSEIVSMAIEKKLDAIAITDHDSIDGILEAMEFSLEKKLKIIPGIEISSTHGGEEVHILGYFFDYKNRELVDLTLELKKHRYNRAKKIVKKLRELGLDIDFHQLEKIGKDKSIGRPLVGQILIEKFYVENMEEAFEKYLGNGAPAYVEKFKLPVEEALSYIHQAGGLAVVAHPSDLSRQNFLEILDLDLDGIECFHPKHTKEDSQYFKQAAQARGMFITAGSDYHGQGLRGRDGLGEYSIEIDSMDYFKRRGE